MTKNKLHPEWIRNLTYILIIMPVYNLQLLSNHLCLAMHHLTTKKIITIIKFQYNLLHCFFVFILGRFSFFFLRISSSILRVGSKVLWDYEFDMHSNVTTPCDVTWLQSRGMGFVRTGHWPIKNRHFYETGDNKFCPCLYFRLSVDFHSLT